jgi:hypothetical protein
LELLVKSLGLVTLDTQVVTAALTQLSSELGVGPEDVVHLLTHQPAMLVCQVRGGEWWWPRGMNMRDRTERLTSALL